VRDTPNHGTSQAVSEEQTGGTTAGQRGTTAQPETHTDTASEGNHGQMASAQQTLELRLGAVVIDDDIASDRVSLLERGLVAGLVGDNARGVVLDVHGEGRWMEDEAKEGCVW
jgi:hypothetical protein